MIDLLKADLKRAVKDKLFIVLSIIAVVFAFITPLLYKFIFALMEVDAETMQELDAILGTINAKAMFFGAFSLGNNFGFILPLFVAIIICKDFSNGTIRNKIICGKSRASIYFSLLITCAILICFFILAHAILTLLISLIFFNYQQTEFTASDFGYLMASIGLEFIIYLLVSAILTFFITSMKNMGLSIVCYFALSFLMIIIGSVTQTAVMFVDVDTVAFKILEFFNVSNPFMGGAIGTGVSYDIKTILYIILPNVIISAVVIVLGLLIFKKRDLK